MLAKKINTRNHIIMNTTITNFFMKKTIQFSLFLFMLFAAFQAQSQTADMTISPNILCAGNMAQYTFTVGGVANASQVESYTLRFGVNDSAVINLGSPVTQFFQKVFTTGQFLNITYIVKFKGGIYPDIVKNYLDTVYNLPSTSYNLAASDSQCFKNNSYCFNNTSAQNVQPSNPLLNYYWVFGDGTVKAVYDTTDRLTCHHYSLGNRVFQTSLRVTDIRGCKTSDADVKSRRDIFVARDIGPSFTLNGTPRCDTTPYTFINTSQTPYGEVGYYVWIFGDGTYYASDTTPTGTKDRDMYQAPFVKKYIIEGVFRPKLIIKHRYFNCIDTFDYGQTGNQLPENIKIKIDIMTRRSATNDSLGDSICYNDFGRAGVCLYNKYALEGPGGTRVGILWDFADPNANPPGSDKFLNQLTPCYKYQDMGQFFPTLRVSCPGSPPKSVMYNYYTKVDTFSDPRFIYRWYPLYEGVANPNYYQENYPPRQNPRLNTINGYLIQPTDSIPLYRFLLEKQIDGTYSIGDSITSHYWFFNNKPLDSVIKFVRPQFWGYGIQIIGPHVQIENAQPYEVAPDPRNHPPITMAQFQKNQCGPDYPVEFVNSSKTYLSEHFYIKWDFGDRDYAPTCTSYSVPNYSTANFGNPPYYTATDMFNRTEGRFIANGRDYIGRYIGCNFSHDTLPIHPFQNWDKVFNWYKFGHDFPPCDTSTTGWTKDPNLVTWNGATGRKFVHKEDTQEWNKPVVAGGPVPTRMDTMRGIWPTDMNPNRRITIGVAIPDPFAQAKGYWDAIINTGHTIDSGGFITPNDLTPMPDGTLRRYRGSDIIPNSNPPRTFYRYVFDRRIQKCYSVELMEYDSFNHKSQDAGFPTDSLIIDALDCHGTSTVQLPLARPDAYGLGMDGKICPGFAAQGGGTPTFTFNTSGFLDPFGNQPSPGTMPPCGRTYLLINQDSLRDRYDNTRCALDAFTDFSGVSPMTGTGVTPGGLSMPPLFNGANWNPLTMWTGPGGNRAIAQYVPGQPGLAYESLPYDPNGWVTIGLILGNGCLSPSNCAIPGCITDTVWYHNFWHFIQLNANFTVWRWDSVIPLKSAFCYLRGKGDEISVHYYDSTQEYLKADAWDWGDGIITVDSFFYGINQVPLARYRYTFSNDTSPWRVLKIDTFEVGVHVRIDTIRDTIWQCNNPLKIGAPGRIDVNIKVTDTAFLLFPVTHRYFKSSWEQMVPGGIPGTFDRRGDITPLQHVMTTTTECLNYALQYLVIGVIDTFDINDTIFCVGETAHFTDSIRYWFPNSGPLYDPFRPLLPGQLPYIDFDLHGEAMKTWPDDTLKIYPNVTKYYPLTSGTCPYGWIYDAATYTKPSCVKIDTFYFERIYWDFQSDGVIDLAGKNPSYKFDAPGRYKVSMISRDSCGYWDTCFRFLNVVKPVAVIASRDYFFCMDTVKFRDSSYVIDQCYINSGGLVSCDYVTSRKWWFGDFGYGPDAYRSVVINPTYDYRKNGKWTVQMVIVTDQGCVDTVRKDIFITGPRPKIILLDDTIGCAPFKVRILSIPDRDLTGIVDTPTKLTLIDWGIPGTQIPIYNSVIDTVEFTYDKAGTYYISGVGLDDYLPGNAHCRPVFVPDTFQGVEPAIRVHVKVPYKVDVETDKQRVCVGEQFKVLNRSELDTIKRFTLAVLDSAFINSIDTLYKTNFTLDTSFKYRLMSPGTYRFVLNSTRFMLNMPPCYWRDTATVVAVKTKAEFDTIRTSFLTMNFINRSDTLSADNYTWYLYNPDGTLRNGYPINIKDGDPMNDYIEEFAKTPDDTGTFLVCLVARMEAPTVCPDSVCKVFDIRFQKKINIPNVFTPNGDKVNDNFVIVIEGEEKYDLSIWNRWGAKVFESDKPLKTWDGSNYNDGSQCPSGTYYYIFTYKLRGEVEKTVRGTITLIRE